MGTIKNRTFSSWAIIIGGFAVIVWLIICFLKFVFWNPADVRFKITDFKLNESLPMISVSYRMSPKASPDLNKPWGLLGIWDRGNSFGYNPPYRISAVNVSTDKLTEEPLMSTHVNDFAGANQIQLVCDVVPYRSPYTEKVISILPDKIQKVINRYDLKRAQTVQSNWFPIDPKLQEAINRSVTSGDNAAE